ncbi:MAG: outer membrane lipoprotein carrier protein LolA [Ignavibacteriae bacterium]|nr:outer membrane lipoprotein carrier protein LolA [Ignavibacteriota bacterium]
MKRINKVIAFFLIFNAVLLFSQITDKDECFKLLLDKYGKMNSVSFKFSSPENKSFQGALTAVKGNKYLIDTKDRDVYCNGETIWNHMIADSEVLISYYDKTNINPMSVENFFFNFLEQYVPSDLTESTSSLGTKSYILQLTPKNEKTYDIDDVKIWIDPKNYIIRSVKLKIAGKIQTLNIDDLVLNKKYPEKMFEYKPTEKDKIMDFR